MALIAVALLLALGMVDERVEAAAERSVAGGVEAVVVMEVASGRVIAQAGHVNRPLPPGSTFKLVDVIAAANTRPEALAGAIHCAGRARENDREIRCWKPAGHGDLTLEEALAQSCNIYFGAVGERVGTAALVKTAEACGVGIGVGRLPALSAPAALVADGEGVLVTALQLASLARQIATGRRRDGATLAPPEALGRLRSGMRAAVEHGTANGAAASVTVAGKTGTAGVGASEVGWFVGLAPADSPTVAVVIERRGVMGHEAAKSAPAILEAFFHGR